MASCLLCSLVVAFGEGFKDHPSVVAPARGIVSEVVDKSAISDVAHEIARQFRPRRIVLFGSYAYGNPNLASDIDLLVIMPVKGHPARKAAEIARMLKSNLPVDLLVRTPDQIDSALRDGDIFLKEVLQKGMVLYDAADEAVGGKSRRRLQQRTSRAARTKAA